jgi:hypothetical protein
MSEDQPIGAEVKTKRKFYKQPVFWAIAVILLLAISIGGGKANKTIITSDTATKTSAAPDATKQQPTAAAGPSATTQTTPTISTPTVSTPTAAPFTAVTPIAPTQTVSQENAVSSAKEYLNTEAFSHDGLVAQLEYEQFSAADATYGADNSGGDWNTEAAESAKEYLDTESFSHDELITQLEYDKYTPDQAAYGVSATGL